MQTVLNGFDTKFSFRISNRSRSCQRAVRKIDGLQDVWDTCNDAITELRRTKRNGGHGFAFVVQNSAAGSSAVGYGKEGLGHHGLENTIAVEFDYFRNADEPNFAHISVRVPDRVETSNVPSSADPLQSFTRRYRRVEIMPPIAIINDANEHTARVTLWRGIQWQYHRFFKATQHMIEFVRGPLHTICIFFEDMVKFFLLFLDIYVCLFIYISCAWQM